MAQRRKLNNPIRLEVRSKHFSGAQEPLFAEFHLQFPPKQIHAIMGPSGVGKSTLLRMLAGLETNFNGSVQPDPNNSPPPAIMFQDPRLLPWLNALDNVSVLHAGMSTTTAQSWLARVGLADASMLFPAEMSGGMQRRVALARALASQSEILLLDEPFSSLDAERSARLEELVVSLASEFELTVVHVSHNPAEVARFAHSVTILSSEKSCKIRKSLQLSKDPSNRTLKEQRLISEEIASWCAK